MSKTILITGASRGFGKLWAEAFLKRGDKVAATARNTDDLNDLVQQYGDAILPVRLDVNDRAACFAAVNEVRSHFGKIDVVINNAGYGLFGAVEETSTSPEYSIPKTIDAIGEANAGTEVVPVCLEGAPRDTVLAGERHDARRAGNWVDRGGFK